MISYQACSGPLALLALLGCSSPPGTAPPATTDSLRLVPVVTSGLSSPVYLTAPTGDTARLFVVEQSGQIRIVQHGQLLPAAFLDIHTRLVSGGEQGLLSVAFHPNYGTNGYLYVNYTDLNGDTRVERYTLSATHPNHAPKPTHKLIMSIPKPSTSHNRELGTCGPAGTVKIGTAAGRHVGAPRQS